MCSETPVPIEGPQVAPIYTLPPTVPSPFAGTLLDSLDAILEFNRTHPGLNRITETLLADVDHSTDWPQLFTAVLEPVENTREIMAEIVFLVTRKLLPEQITENRALMYRMYSNKRNYPTRISLRYDMERERHKRPNARDLLVESRPPSIPPLPTPEPIINPAYPERPPFMPNIISTLIAAPAEGGYGTKKMADAMRHHITELDRLLALTDKDVSGWNGTQMVVGAVAVILQWQWLRADTKKLEDLEVGNWEELDGKAEDCEWVRDMKD